MSFLDVDTKSGEKILSVKERMELLKNKNATDIASSNQPTATSKKSSNSVVNQPHAIPSKTVSNTLNQPGKIV